MQINILKYLEEGGARHFPEKIAVVDSERSYTFAEMERNSKRCGALLLQRHNSIGQPIAVYLPKSAEVIFANLGIVYSGNVYMNLDTKSPPQRIKAILDHIRPILIVTSR